MSGPLVDVHAHFDTDRCGRSDWAERNARRLEVGARLGITVHVASILGSWGRTSPTYFPSVEDLAYANAFLRRIVAERAGTVRGYVAVNPNFTAEALAEIALGVEQGMVGVKLAASRRASDRLLDPIAAAATDAGLPILQHAWQHRRREVANQEISDAVDLAILASRHPRARFILAHIGGGGDWAHSLRVLREVPNVWVDLSGSGVDRGMLELCLDTVGVPRLLFGTDLTMDTGVAKLRALEALGLSVDELEAVRWRNAASVFGRRVMADR